MTDSKLINLLKSLSPDEFKQFEKFVDSSFYNKGRDLTPLMKVIKPFYPEFDDIKLTNEFLFKKIFPGKKYDKIRSENLIRTLSSHLFRICKEFLIYLELENQTVKKKYLLLNQLRKKGLYKEFDREFGSLDYETEDNSKGSIGYFFDEYLISSVKRDCSLNRDDFAEAFEYTIKASENTVAAALISCFKFEDEKNLAQAYNLNLGSNIVQPLLDNLNSVSFLNSLNKNGSRYFPYIEIFLTIYMMNKFRDKTEYFFKLKDLLKKYSAIFGHSENYVLWNILLTYCGINKLGARETFLLYRHILENGFYKLSQKEDFHIVLFRNIVIDTSSIFEYKWLEEFINKYSEELNENHRENMRAYSMAYLLFARSEFEKALENIMKIKYNLFLFKLDLKILQLKIYYELGFYEEGLSLVSATLSYINSTKELAEFIKESIGNFAKCMRELIKIRSDASSKKIDLHELKLKVKNIFHTNLSGWIMEKISEIEKSV